MPAINAGAFCIINSVSLSSCISTYFSYSYFMERSQMSFIFYKIDFQIFHNFLIIYRSNTYRVFLQDWGLWEVIFFSMRKKKKFTDFHSNTTESFYVQTFLQGYPKLILWNLSFLLPSGGWTLWGQVKWIISPDLFTQSEEKNGSQPFYLSWST